jgi:hypothetical protein
MDNAVALVQAYLRVNGDLTVSEYPVLEALREAGGPAGYQSRTDLDILAFRFPGAGPPVNRRDRAAGAAAAGFETDPVLMTPADGADMLIGEVKEGQAELNTAARDPFLLQAALARFGCCPAGQAAAVADDLLRHGAAALPAGHRARLVASRFGAGPTPPSGAALAVSLGHIVSYLQAYVREHWPLIRASQSKDPVFSLLVTLEKARRDRSARRT